MNNIILQFSVTLDKAIVIVGKKFPAVLKLCKNLIDFNFKYLLNINPSIYKYFKEQFSKIGFKEAQLFVIGRKHVYFEFAEVLPFRYWDIMN